MWKSWISLSGMQEKEWSCKATASYHLQFTGSCYEIWWYPSSVAWESASAASEEGIVHWGRWHGRRRPAGGKGTSRWDCTVWYSDRTASSLCGAHSMYSFELYHNCRNYPQSVVWANSADPDQTAPSGGSPLELGISRTRYYQDSRCQIRYCIMILWPLCFFTISLIDQTYRIPLIVYYLKETVLMFSC